MLLDEFEDHPISEDGQTVRNVIESFGNVDMEVFYSTCHEVLDLLGQVTPHVFRSVRLGVRTDAKMVFQPYPSLKTIADWRREDGISRVDLGASRRRAAEKSYEDILLELPPEKRRRRGGSGPTGAPSGGVKTPAMDPIHVLNALGFAKFLRTPRDFTPAMGAAFKYDNPDCEEEERDSSKDPGRSTLDDAFTKLDIVDLLLLRRRLHADASVDAILAINVYSDSSPVSGEEIQGMLIDITRRNGDNERITLPGGTLSYGLFDSVSKSICLLHAFWLLAGPDVETVQYMCDKVVACTTDFGTEMHLLEMRDVTRAYCLWMSGYELDNCRQFVDVNRRWLERAVRISGWSHTYGNIMKHTAETSARWPKILDKMRACVSFLRVATWRDWIAEALKIAPPDDFDVTKLQHFCCTMAKWRYETITVTMETLNVFRNLFERHLKYEWFQNAQDREMLKSVFDAAADPFLWKFMCAAAREVFTPTERDRHWGMICGCEEHLRQRREGAKHILCWENGRRLKDAFEYISDTATARIERSRTLTVQECEGDSAVHDIVTMYLKQLGTMQKQRMGYLGRPPWTAVHCRSIEGSKRFLEQVARYPLEQHDAYTQYLLRTIGGFIHARAQGEDAHPQLLEAVDRLDTVNLHEGCGEGWHRGSQHEKVRAYASTSQHLKRVNRRPGVFKRIRQFRLKYGARGCAVLRYEWRNWKRIVHRTGRWAPRNITKKRVRHIVYREGETSRINWSRIVSREPNLLAPHTEQAEHLEQVQNEYLRGCMERGRHYGFDQVPTPSASSGAAAASEPTQSINFRLLGISHGRSRAHVMPVVGAEEDVSQTASLALNVQFESRRVRTEEEPPLNADVTEVFDEGDPQWVRPFDLVPFETLQRRLMDYRRVEPSPTEGCILLSDPHVIQPMMPIMDKAYPVLALIQHLKRRGWTPANGTVTHTSITPGEFDCEEAPRFRKYYQCLVRLKDVLPLTNEMPSREPMAYYGCLLLGLEAIAGKSAKDYQIVLNAALRKKGGRHELPAILDEADEVAGGTDIILPGAQMLPAPPAPKRASAPGYTRRPAGAGGGHGGHGGGGTGEARDPIPLPTPPVVEGGGGSGGAGGSGGPSGSSGPPVRDAIVVASNAVVVPAPKMNARRHLGREFKPALCGTEISYKAYPKPNGKGYYRNYIIKCPCNPGCHKTRGRCEQFMRVHGEVEPLAWLHAWLFVSVPEGRQHNKEEPTDEQMEAFFVQNEQALRQLFPTLVSDPEICL